MLVTAVASRHHLRWLNWLMQHLVYPFASSSAPLEEAETWAQSKRSLDLALAQAPQGAVIAQAQTADRGTLPREAHSSSQERYPARPAARHRLRSKQVRLVINPRAGHNFTRISEVLAVFAAAGWKTDIAVKLHGWHAMELASEAAEGGYDLVIAYGGDGTLGQVVNGVMAANGKKRPAIVGVLPGGTANQWVTETSEPIDPVKAALSLIESDVGTVDLGRIGVQALQFPNAHEGGQKREKKHRRARKSKAKRLPRVANYFLLTAGLGFDAAVIGHTSKTMKQHVGRLAFDLAAAEVLPEKHAFPLEVASLEADGREATVLWSGEAYQVILGNTRRYADLVEMTPDAYVDDGKLDLCVIAEGNVLATLEQMLSLLLRHRPDTITARSFQAAHFLITVPASVHLQLDGSSVQLEDYLSKADRKTLQQAPDRGEVMATYRFDALPHALRVALPEAYDHTLFEHTHDGEDIRTPDERPLAKAPFEQHEGQQGEVQREFSDLVNTLLEDGYKATVAGIAAAPGKKCRYIIAGHTKKRQTGETKPVAIRIDEDTVLLSRTGERVPQADLLKLRDGSEVIVLGQNTKRGVIKAKQVVVLGW